MIDVNHKTQIYDLCRHTEFIQLLAAWHRMEWPEVVGCREELLRTRTSFDVIPKTFVAVGIGQQPLGFASLTAKNLPDTDLGPWLTSLLIAPASRGRGVGQRLVEHCLRYAASAGFEKLFLHTVEAPDYYRRLGWVEVNRIGQKIVFEKQC